MESQTMVMVATDHPQSPLKAFRSVAIVVAVILASTGIGRTAETPPALVFGKNCTGCHTYGKGVKVGPDLKGVTTRRSRAWLHSFIRSSQGLIRTSDPIATQLFRQFKQQQMPDWNFSDRQIDALLDYFASGGPEKKRLDQRPASMASQADVERGRKLFSGEIPLKHVNFACSSCHPIAGDSEVAGGSLGPDLTSSYARFQDEALTSRLEQPCPPIGSMFKAASYLTPDELFALKAYLRRTATAVKTMAGRINK